MRPISSATSPPLSLTTAHLDMGPVLEKYDSSYMPPKGEFIYMVPPPFSIVYQYLIVQILGSAIAVNSIDEAS